MNRRGQAKDASRGRWSVESESRWDTGEPKTKNEKRKTKKGQVTIFIIVGILIVVGVFMVIFLAKDGAEVVAPVDLSPRDFVVSCVEDIVEDSIERIMYNGGDILGSRSITYKDESWNYLCYQADFNFGCHVYSPLEVHIEEEIKKDTLSTSVGVGNCFNLMRANFEDRGFDVSLGVMEYSIDLVPGSVEVSLSREIDITDEGGSQSFDNFDVKIGSSIYELVQIARIIMGDEAEFGNFDHVNYNLLNPRYVIDQEYYASSRLYVVGDKVSGEEFKFAVRSFVSFPDYETL